VIHSVALDAVQEQGDALGVTTRLPEPPAAENAGFCGPTVKVQGGGARILNASREHEGRAGLWRDDDVSRSGRRAGQIKGRIQHG
jgi:hypothetical protein